MFRVESVFYTRRRPPGFTLFPYTTLFRSREVPLAGGMEAAVKYHFAMVLPLMLDREPASRQRSEEHTSELQSRQYLVCRLLLEKKKHTRHISAQAFALSSDTSVRRVRAVL